MVLVVPRLVLTVAFLPLQEGLRAASRRFRSNGDDGHDDDVRTVAVLPHVSYASGFGTTLGIAGRYENLGGYGEEAALTAGIGGVYAQFGEVALRADRAAGSPVWLESRTRYEIRPQQVFQGVGDGSSAIESRYREDRLTAVARGGVSLGEDRRLVRVGGSLVFERSSFGAKDDGYSAAPSIESVYDTHDLPGFDRGVKTVEAQMNLFVDTRDAVAKTSSGVLASAYVGAVPALQQQYGYTHVGFDVRQAIDLYKKNRVLVLRAAFEGVLGERADIPWSRLARLGGEGSLRGYLFDRFRDRESALVSAEYHYPIHEAIAAAVFVDAGHVAPDPASLTAFSRWRAGGGVGLRIRTKDTTLASLDLAYGDAVQLFFTIFPFDSRAQWNKP
jgi:outer membrane protein assembly factor BamA